MSHLTDRVVVEVNTDMPAGGNSKLCALDRVSSVLLGPYPSVFCVLLNIQYVAAG